MRELFNHLPAPSTLTPESIYFLEQAHHAPMLVRTYGLSLFNPGPRMNDRLRPGAKLVLATGNANKLQEAMNSVTLACIFDTISSKELKLPSPDETGKSYIDNAAIKAVAAAQASKLPALGDDRGIAFDAYDGQPSVQTIDWLTGKKIGFEKIREIHRHKRSTGATSVCAMAIAFPDGTVAGAEVFLRGHIVKHPAGKNGFGFDRHFRPNWSNKTYAQMSTPEKVIRGEIGAAIRQTMQYVSNPFGL